METLGRQDLWSWFADSTLPRLLSSVPQRHLQSFRASTQLSNQPRNASPVQDVVGKVARLHGAGKLHHYPANRERFISRNLMEPACLA